ncbi:substrate-binding periplasmic protein [Pseudoalteromonas 'SMAR']|uniref:substrate-binding periplasmic protein n=1 Tax=Pseudoalteromonas 'SMAR' TaxID=3416908 RepID=UPI003AF29BAF
MRYLLVTLWLAVCVPVQAGTLVRFCYEDKDAPPFIHGAGLKVPASNPGLSIELVQTIDALVPEVKFEYVRKPWNRCLHELQQGKVDAVLASYRQERESFMTYPKNSDGSLAEQYAVNRIGSCLLQHKQNVAPLNVNKRLRLAIPRGYAVKGLLPSNYSILDTDSLPQAIRLVEQGLLDATVGLCQIGNMAIELAPAFAQLKAVYPPLEVSYGFVSFSRQFYGQYQDASRLIWQASLQIDLDQMYQAYLLQQSSP